MILSLFDLLCAWSCDASVLPFSAVVVLVVTLGLSGELKIHLTSRFRAVGSMLWCGLFMTFLCKY